MADLFSSSTTPGLKRAAAEIDLAAASRRVLDMQASVTALAERATALNGQVANTVSRTRDIGSASMPLDEPEDPLEKKFRDLM